MSPPRRAPTRLPNYVISASISRRMGAAVLDQALIGAAFWCLYVWQGVVPASGAGFHAALGKWPTAIGLWIYFAAMESSRLQATLGKLVFRVRVCDYAFERITFLRAALRHLARAVLGASLLVMMWTLSMQGIHDLATHTLVLEIRDLDAHRRNRRTRMDDPRRVRPLLPVT